MSKSRSAAGDPPRRNQRVSRVVREILRGRVATYGEVALLAGLPGGARQVGYALNRLPDNLDIPWQRVINAKGKVSPRANPIYEKIQKQILETEGIRFDSQGRISLETYQWNPGTK